MRLPWPITPSPAPIHQEVIAIDFEGPGIGQVCQIRIKELAHSSPLIQKYIRTKTMMDSVLGHLELQRELGKYRACERWREEYGDLQKNNMPFEDADTKEFMDFAKGLGINATFETQYVCKPNPDPRRDIEDFRRKTDGPRSHDYKIIDDPLREELKRFHWPGEFECFFSTNLPQGQGRCGFRGGDSTHGAPCRGRLDCLDFKSVQEVGYK